MKIVKRGYKSKICVIAGSPDKDGFGAELISGLSLNEPNLRIYGLGGSKMSSIFPQFENYGNLAKQINRQFYPYFNTDIDPRFYLNLPLLMSNIRNFMTIRELTKNEFFKNFLNWNGQRTNAVITLGNELLSIRLHEKITKMYDSIN